MVKDRRTSGKWDVAIIGAGPAGLAAAMEASKHGLSAVLFDEQHSPGGQVYRALEAPTSSREWAGSILGPDYLSGRPLIDAFRSSGCDYRPGSLVWQVLPDGTLGIHDASGIWQTSVRRAILCTGAQERPVPLPGWTLPGVMTVGAAQTLLKSSGLVPSGRVAIAGSGPLVYLFASQLLRAGVECLSILITTPSRQIRPRPSDLPAMIGLRKDFLKGYRWVRKLRACADRFVASGVTDIRIAEGSRMKSLSFVHAGRAETVEADLVLLHEGVIPNIQITRSLRCDHNWDALQRCWVPATDAWGATSQPAIALAGDGAGIMGASVAPLRGQLAALDAAFRIGRLSETQRDRQAAPLLARVDRVLPGRRLLDRMFSPDPGMLLPPGPDAIVCRCEDVTRGAIEAAVAEGATDCNLVKTATRCGMGPCQGRMCGVTIAEVIASSLGIAVHDVSALRGRFPIKPVPLAAFVALAAVPESHAS